LECALTLAATNLRLKATTSRHSDVFRPFVDGVEIEACSRDA